MGTEPSKSWASISGQRPQAGVLGRAVFGFTLVELLVVIAILAMVLAGLLPAVGSFMKSSGMPNTVSLIDVNSRGARNYAVANNVTTALVFVEEDSGSERRVLMFVAKMEIGNPSKFVALTTWESSYLADRIVVSSDVNRDNPEAPVAICFLPSGQLTDLGTDSEPIEVELPNETLRDDVISERSFYLYDAQTNIAPQQIRINYYPGSVVD